MPLIKPDQIAFTATITEDELRDRLAREVMESIGALSQDGTPAPGVEPKVHRGEGRKGGYKITVTGPVPSRMLIADARGDDT